MLQAIDAHLPGIFESGSGLYISSSYRFLPHPALGDGSRFRAIRLRLEESLIRSGQAFIQPGKEFTLSLFAQDPAETKLLYDWTRTALGSLTKYVDLVYSASCLNILPRGIHKGKGIQFLAHQTGYPPAEMLGVGDSDIDLPFLATVGHSAAPANANPKVKRRVHYVAPRPSTDGVRDILNHFELI
jgi:hydroxymethylpyrimidine pyrophosphatase-like HAD family hydrolase